MFCEEADLKTESDVEQKLIYPLLTHEMPNGLGYSPIDIRTKADLRQVLIDKGRSEKLYYPDYLILIAGHPCFVIEAKKPGESIEDAIREARLYAVELNASYPSGVNPCVRVAACNGNRFATAAVDSSKIDLDLTLADLHVGSQKLKKLVELLGRPAALAIRNKIFDPLKSSDYFQALSFVGGQTVRNEQIAPNSFGSNFALDYRPIFNPNSRKERAHIARNAYISSQRREAYVGEIDRFLRNAISSILPDVRLITDTADPSPILAALRTGRKLENEIMLLIGEVGCGKSTFVDYLSEVKLPPEVAACTEWVRLNLNNAPDERMMLEGWLLDQLKEGLERNHPEIDFPARDTLDAIFEKEIHDLRRGPLARLPTGTYEYEMVIANKLMDWMNDKTFFVKRLSQYLCKDNDKLLIVVFDNCDKRDRESQLRTFEVARWLQTTIQCLIILPIRDVTYRLYADVPPLDTKIKDLVFRIEPPSFSKVLLKRMELVLDEMVHTSGSQGRLEYQFPNGYKVVYPASELGQYVACIFQSLYEHDKLIRGLLTGLAGRNIRRAMEIFLEFCRSGHIGEHEFLKIKHAKGRYSLPRNIVYQVLLRRNRRYYDGDDSFLKNVYQCNPSDAAPDHLARLSILFWLHKKFKVKGPTGIEGFHPCRQLLSDLVVFGHDIDRLRAEVGYLIQQRCILTEHQRDLLESDNDLLALSPAGRVHIAVVGNPTYVAACAEDACLGDKGLAINIAERIAQFGPRVHYSGEIAAINTQEFFEYLRRDAGRRYIRPSTLPFGVTNCDDPLDLLEEAILIADKKIRSIPNAVGWRKQDDRFTEGKVCPGHISGIKEYGLFVTLDEGPTGLVHISTLAGNVIGEAHTLHQRVLVRIERIERNAGKASLILVRVGE